MINYHRSAFGLNLLFRIHGSAVYRAFFPALLSVLVFLFLRLYINDGNQQPEEPTLEHPYVIGVVVGGITFLIVFRASSSYARYWEATSSIYQMQSKWMDATVHTACYHMQCKHYDHIKPPSFFDYPELNAQFLTRDRERVTLSKSDRGHQGVMNSKRAMERSINVVESAKTSDGLGSESTHSKRNSKLQQQASTLFETASSVQARRSRTSRISFAVNRQNSRGSSSGSINSINSTNNNSDSPRRRSSIDDPSIPHFLSGRERLDGNWGALFPDGKATFVDPQNRRVRHPMGFASCQGGRTPPIFLQELAHLASLMTAVALSTLRNDVDGAESPLDFYHIGSPWPEVDPKDIPELYVSGFARISANLQYFLGVARTPEERTKYNAARPLSVLGGVSDNEITFLQMARGPYAKTQLCWNWVSEFITREHLAGTLGDVGPPIISRIIQFLGDGMVHYNHARKIMFIPFPFPHAQLSAVYVLVMIPMIPYMMDQYCVSSWIGCTLTFLSVACLSGIHEVARELENPFRNVPNELPVCTLMAEFNEALVTMYAGYHPDFFWEVENEDEKEEVEECDGSSSSDYHLEVNNALGDDHHHHNNNNNNSKKNKKKNRGNGSDDDDGVGLLFSQSSRRRPLHKETLVEGSCEDTSSADEEQRNREDDELAAAAAKTNDDGNEIILASPANNNTKTVSFLPSQNGTNGSNKNKNKNKNNMHESAMIMMTTCATHARDASSHDVASNLSPPGSNNSNNNNSSNNNNNKHNETPLEVDQLRAIVLQQGKMMEKMLEEQARLNKMIEAVFQQNGDAASVDSEDTATA